MKQTVYSWQSILCLIGLLFMALSCSHNQSPQTMKDTHEGSQSLGVLYTLRDYTIPQSAIEQDALSLMNAIAPSSLRGAERRIAEVIPLQSETSLRSTDSADIAPLAYVVNFADNKGYAVLSSDIRLNPVWAVSTVGNLDVDKEPDNPTAKMLLQQVEVAYNINRYAVSDGINNFVDHIVDGDGKPIRPEKDFTKVEYGPWEKIPSETYEALIPVAWGQTDAPYNLYTSHLSRHAGCVTAAVAQIMAFHQYPVSYDWSLMLQHRPLAHPYRDYNPAFDEIARLYRDLGKSLKVKYGEEGSTACNKDVPNTFYSFGYSHCNKPKDYTIEQVKKELRRSKGYPIYMSATDKITVYYKYSLWRGWQKHVEYQTGHAFVIDGITRAKRLVRTINTITGEEMSQQYEYTTLLHANLGWNRPYLNGYYHTDIFDTRNEYGPILKAMSEATYGTTRVYCYNFYVITGIRP